MYSKFQVDSKWSVCARLPNQHQSDGLSTQLVAHCGLDYPFSIITLPPDYLRLPLS